IVPAHPPLPTAWNLPFHPVNGSQTSTLMSESLDGRIVAATRQNAGTPRNTCPAGPDGLAPAEPGGVNAPASTTLASVMVVCGSAIDARLSHEAAAPRMRPPTSIASSAADKPPNSIFMACRDFTLES